MCVDMSAPRLSCRRSYFFQRREDGHSGGIRRERRLTETVVIGCSTGWILALNSLHTVPATSYAARSATTSTGTASLKLNRDPLGSPFVNDSADEPPACRHSAPRRNSSTACAQARAVSAMYVSDGFWQADEVMQAPSVTTTFGESWH
jgi:hypothetical protein